MPQNPVQVQILRQSALPSQAGFETILLAGYHTVTLGPRVSTVTSISDAESQGFTAAAAPAINRALTTAFSQQPRPNQIKIGRRDSPTTQNLKITPKALVGEGFVWTLGIDGTTVSYTEAGGETIATLIDGIVAAVTTAALGVTPTDNVTDFDLVADTAGEIHSFTFDRTLYDLEDNTTDPGVAADLSAISSEDDDWYFLALDHAGEAETIAASTWVEARTKLFGTDVYESGVADSVDTGDVASQLQTSQRRKTFVTWTNGKIGQHAALGLASFYLPFFSPGTATFAFKPTLGIDTYRLNGADIATLEAKNVNWLGEFGGRFVWQQGVVAAGEFIDIERTAVFIRRRQQEIFHGILLREPKIEFTDIGIEQIKQALLAFLQSLLDTTPKPVAAPDPPPSVDGPTTITDPDRAERKVRGITTAVRLAGAIQAGDVNTFLET